MKRLILLLCLLLAQQWRAQAATMYLEKEYQAAWCDAHNGVKEYILPDRTRVDCLTSNYAIEFDFAKKWGESIGQALYYASVTGKKAGIVLIMEDAIRDKKYYKRVETVANLYGIKLWTITPEYLLISNKSPKK